MSEGGYKIRNQAAIHFITFAVVSWIDVFTRKDYRDILLDSIRFCQREKGLVVYSWCIMSNHVHLIVSARNNNLSDVLRDFACTEGVDAVKHRFPDFEIWVADLDEELTAKGYIVPGLGDAGDLSFGSKMQF